MSRALNSIETFLEMLRYRRPAGSKTERRFIREYIRPLGVREDLRGNLIKRIGTAPVLWSSHTDSVHREGGFQHVDVTSCVAHLNAKSTSNCLGADDAAGVWLMREMILAERPGLYVFHRAEETGGNGSRFIALETPGLLEGISYAIAFDRRGTQDVITHQAGGRCCSDAFAWSLAEALGTGYSPSDAGIFTDTANYTDLIGECTNVSVGYAAEHSKREAIDLRHILPLRDALLALDVGALDSMRQPGEVDPDDFTWPYGEDQTPRSDNDNGRREMRNIIEDNAVLVADLLEEYGYDARSLEDDLMARVMR